MAEQRGPTLLAMSGGHTPLKIAHAFRLSSDFGFEFWNAGPSVTQMGGNHR